MEITNIKKWAKGKPEFPAYIAMFFVSTIPTIYSIRNTLRVGNVFVIKLKDSEIKNWHKFYRKHRIVLNSMAVFSEFSNNESIKSDAIDESMEEIVESDDNIVNLPQDIKKQFDEIIKLNALQSYNLIHQNKTDSSSDDLHQEENIEQFKSLFENPPLLYMISVWLPCLFEYNENPVLLMRKARLGDLESIEKILRLDKFAMHDPKISQQRDNALRDFKKLRYKRICKAMESTPSKLKRKTVKNNVAGLISKLTEDTGHKLKPSAIQSLFDAAAKDFGMGLFDKDFPDDPESFRKTIQRNKPSF